MSAPDGWVLDVLDLRPTDGAPKGVVVAGHAMMVDRRTLYREGRDGLAARLVAQGFRVLVPDLRGHGQSGPRAAQGGRWSYDDLVADTSIYIELARELEPELPLSLVGHSLFGHTALAWLGRHPEAPVAALVAIAVNIWTARWESRPDRWLLKAGMLEAVWALTRVSGYVPVRRAGAGTADESLDYWRSFVRWSRSNRWDALDGADYHGPLARVRCPVLHVISEGDRLFGEPDAATDFLAPLGERRTIWRLGAEAPTSLAGIAPDHMGLVTSPTSGPLWDSIGAWLLARLVNNPGLGQTL